MHQKPSVTVDGIVFLEGRLVLVKRKNPPFDGHYALPGGFVDYGETVESAIIREMREETGLDTRIVKLIGVYSDPERDPRGHMITVVFELEHVGGVLKEGDDAAEVALLGKNELPKLAFDHQKIVEDYFKSA